MILKRLILIIFFALFHHIHAAHNGHEDFHEQLCLAIKINAPLNEIEKLVNCDAFINAQYGDFKSTLCHMAASWNRGDVIDLLVKHGADVNVKNMFEEAPLHSACYNNAVIAAKALLQAGANREHKTKYQKTPLDIARDCDSQDIVQLLTEWQDLPV